MKHFFMFLILSLLPGRHSVHAQQKTQVELDQQKMQQASFIFEGELVSTDGYFNADRSRVFRSSIIRVTRSLRGKLQEGSVQVVYKGPRVGAIVKDPKTGETLVQVPDDNGHGNSDNQGFTLPKGKPILFFCRPLPANFEPNPKRVSTENDMAMEVVGLAYDIFRNNTILSDVGGKFANQEELHRYLNKTYQVPLPAPERQLNLLQRDSVGKANRVQWDLMEKRIQEIKADNKQKSKRNGLKGAGAFAPTSTQELSFTIQNPAVTGTSPQYLDYDVFVQSATGNSYFSNAVMEFGYNTAAFGSALGTMGNTQVTATSGPAFPSSTYRSPNVVEGSDPTPSFRVGFGVIFNGTGFNRVRITSTPVKLVHIHIQITNCTATSGIEFVNDANVGSSYDLFATSATTSDQTSTYIFYDPITYNDYPGGIPLCSFPAITGFTPVIQAGTEASGSLLTITGTGFGSSRGTVELRDADVGGTQYMALDDYDIQSWSNTQIQVRVPGTVSVGTRTSQTGIPLPGTCSSGRIKVRSAAGTATESPLQLGDLDVEYALSQNFYATLGGTVTHKARRHLAKNNCTDGFTFRVDNTLRNDANAIKVIESALASWSVRLGVYLALERDVQGVLVSQASMSAQADGVNSLFYDVLSGNVLMRTSSNTFTCGSGTALRAETNDADIAINVGSSWDYSLQGNVQGESFLSAFLHELGHVLGIAHVVTPNTAANLQQELMYYQTNSNPIAANRQSLTSGRSKAVSAALDITAQSRLQTWCNPNVQTLGSSGSTACQSTKPLAPGLQAQANVGVNRTITLTWNAIYNATGYTIQSSVSPTTGFTNYGPVFSGSVSTYTTGNLDPLTPYYFRIRASNAAGSSPYSNVASATTAARSNPKPLAAPTNLQTVPTSGPPLSNYISWSYPTAGATFVVTRASNVEFLSATQFTTAIDARNFADTDAIAGTVYFYRVYAQLSGNESDDTPPVSCTASGCTPLTKVGPVQLAGIQSPDRSNDFYCQVQQAPGAVRYTWNFASPVAATEGWTLSSGTDAVVASYQGPIPYTGSTTTIMVEITDNCGTSEFRYLELPTPVYNGGSTESRNLQVKGDPRNAIAVYPNPAQRQLYVELPAAWKDSWIRVLDLKTGLPLRKWQTNALRFETSLNGIPAGIYLIEFSVGNTVQRQRLEVAP